MTAETRLDRREWTVLPVSQATCERLVWLHHYARSAGKQSAYRHGLFHVSDLHTCRGVAQWFPPTREAAAATWAGDWHHVLGLSRLAIAPDVPANGASYLIAQSIKLIRAAGRYHCLVTYADTWQGHTGAIYRATNWEYLGLTDPKPRWLDPQSGSLVSQYAGGTFRGKARMVALGYQHLGDFATHKYRLVLPTSRRRTLFSALAGQP